MVGVRTVALLPFSEHLDKIGSFVEFVSTASAFKRALPDVVDWNSHSEAAVQAARDFMGLDAAPEQLYINSLYLSSVAGFEEFLRKALETSIRAYSENTELFDGLSEGLQRKHIVATGRLLSLMHSPPHHLNVDFFDVCRRLGTCVPGSEDFQLNVEALSLVRDIVGLEDVFDILNQCGVNVSWDRLVRLVELQECLKTKGARNTGKELKRYLIQMARYRHRIAHTGAASDVTKPLLEDHIDLLRARLGG